jgi:hypothetical protein
MVVSRCPVWWMWCSEAQSPAGTLPWPQGVDTARPPSFLLPEALLQFVAASPLSSPVSQVQGGVWASVALCFSCEILVSW